MTRSVRRARERRAKPVFPTDIAAACRAVAAPDAPAEAYWPGAAPHEPVLGGAFEMRRFPDGMEAHFVNGMEMRTTAASFELGPGLSVFVLLEGYLAFSVDGEAWDLGADESGNAYNGLIWARARPTKIERQMRRGRHLTKLALTLPPGWIDRYEALSPRALTAFRARHLAQAQWAPSERAIRAAWDIVRPMGETALARAIAMQTNALAIVSEALETFELADGDDAEAEAQVDAQAHFRAAQARAYLDETLDRDEPLRETARQLGMSVSSLQACFRDAFQVTVGEYRRRQRLIRANVALRDQGISIADAARQAGYRSAANFATAFSRAFGYPPSQARR